MDPQVKTADGQLFDVLFVGTDNGRVLKIVHPTHHQQQPPLLVEEIQVASTAEPILGALVYILYIVQVYILGALEYIPCILQ